MADESQIKVEDCIKIIGVESKDLEGLDGLQDEFKVIKKAFHKKARDEHPDKGGTNEGFVKLRDAFNTLKQLFEDNAIDSFAASLASSFEVHHDSDFNFTAPWEYYEEAEKETIPTYRVEPARSNRSKCQKTKEKIPKGTLRVGWIDMTGGSYGRWTRYDVWRIPRKIWLGFPTSENATKEDYEKALLAMNEILLCGFSELSKEDREVFVEHCMKKEHWTYKGKAPKTQETPKPKPTQEEESKKPAPTTSTSTSTSTSTAAKAEPKSSTATASAQASVIDLTSIVESKPATTEKTSIVKASAALTKSKKFKMPKPGVDGSADALKGQTIVLTGVFPEVGGGAGLSLGKDRVKAMIESFGGRCTGSISGKTTMLIVGKDPGFSKVSKARGKPKVKLLSITDLTQAYICQEKNVEDTQPVKITNFSAGYGYNSLALEASNAELDFARGKTQALPMAAEEEPAKKKAKHDNQYSTMNVNDLKGLLRERSLPVSGRKAELISRLEEYDVTN